MDETDNIFLLCFCVLIQFFKTNIYCFCNQEKKNKQCLKFNIFNRRTHKPPVGISIVQEAPVIYRGY